MKRDVFVLCEVHVSSIIAYTNSFTANRVSPVAQFYSKQVLGRCQNNQAGLQTVLEFYRVSIGFSQSVRESAIIPHTSVFVPDLTVRQIWIEFGQRNDGYD
jgi:hypothetical protein